MKAGRMRSSVDVQRLSTAKDEHGQPVDEWSSLVRRRAAIDQTGGGEYVSADAENARTVVVIRMRYDSTTKTITTKDRIVHGDINYDIQSINNMQMKNRDLLFTCEATNGI